MELCEVCRVNTATIHLTQVEHGEPITRHLCQDCAEDEGIPGLPEMGQTEQQDSIEQEEILPLTCPHCNTNEDQIAGSGEVGCAQCYSIFRTLIQEKGDFRSNYQRYDGKKYRQSGSRSFQSELDTLRRELGAAITQERFEVAAVLRDRIREIEANEESSWS